MFAIAKYMVFVRGLYAPAGQFLPPFVVGHPPPEQSGRSAAKIELGAVSALEDVVTNVIGA